jgi:hypothetical protein
LFWTIPIAASDVKVDFPNHHAAMDVVGLDVEDYHDIVNALKEGKSVPATVSFHVRWKGVKDRARIRDFTHRFAGAFIQDTVTVEWSAKRKGFRFHSFAADTAETEFAVLAAERNGVYF